jgi:hypothetical protein
MVHCKHRPIFRSADDKQVELTAVIIDHKFSHELCDSVWTQFINIDNTTMAFNREKSFNRLIGVEELLLLANSLTDKSINLKDSSKQIIDYFSNLNTIFRLLFLR